MNAPVLVVAHERAKLRAEDADARNQTPRRRVRNGRPCPLQPCPAELGPKDLLCDWHWGFSTPTAQEAYRRAVAMGDVAEATALALVVLCAVRLDIERTAAPVPQSHRGYLGVRQSQVCPCRACQWTLRWARRMLDVDETFWTRLCERQAWTQPAEPEVPPEALGRQWSRPTQRRSDATPAAAPQDVAPPAAPCLHPGWERQNPLSGPDEALYRCLGCGTEHLGQADHPSWVRQNAPVGRDPDGTSFAAPPGEPPPGVGREFRAWPEGACVCCGEPLERSAARGRPRRFCTKQACERARRDGNPRRAVPGQLVLARRAP
jgi:hypothetical protein